MKINGHEITRWHVLMELGRAAGYIVLIATVGWKVVSANADEYIKVKVAEIVNERFDEIETSIKQVQMEQQEQAQVNARNGIRLENLKDGIKRNEGGISGLGTDVKEVLRFLRNR